MGLSTAALLMLGTSALAGGANYINQRNTQRDRNNLLLSAEQTNRKLQNQADTKTSHLISQIAGSTPNAEQANYEQTLKQVLSGNQSGGQSPLVQPGAVSGAYQGQAAQTGQGIRDYGNTQAALDAAMAAPGLQRRNEGFDMNRTRQQLSVLGEQAASNDFLTRLRLEGIQPNPWIAALGSLAGGAANAWGASQGKQSYAEWLKANQRAIPLGSFSGSGNIPPGLA